MKFQAIACGSVHRPGSDLVGLRLHARVNARQFGKEKENDEE